MTEIFGFDAKCLSDDQLFTKQIELTRLKSIAARYGNSNSADQFENLIQAIEYERRERMFLERAKQIPSSPVVLETDPRMREQALATQEANAPKSATPVRPIRRAIRTSTPVVPTDGV